MDVISPVWYELGYDKINGDAIIKGPENKTWLNEMREKHPNVQIYPRVVFDLGEWDN
jgi:hypothetical protein